MKNMMIVVGVSGLVVVAALYWQKELNPETCEAYCMTNESCMRALDSSGIAPYGSTSNDKGLCNGICTTLVTQTRQAKKHAKQFGMDPGGMDFSHACIPE